MSRAAPGHPFRLQLHDSLASTSDACIGLARAGEPADLAVVARAQTAGRGRSGAAWSAPMGNLALSVLLRPRWPAAAAGQWSLLTGVAVIEALAAPLAGPDRLRLKWPNDILLDGRKLAGILIDSEAAGASLAWLVIGIGVNLACAPVLADRATACLAEAGASMGIEAAAEAILGRLAVWRDILYADGIAAVRAAWLARAHPIGSPLRATTAAGCLTGRFAGLAPSGALLLEVDGRTHFITAAEVEPLQIDLPLPTS